jgi:hypothetical protein
MLIAKRHWSSGTLSPTVKWHGARPIAFVLAAKIDRDEEQACSPDGAKRNPGSCAMWTVLS